MSETLPRGLKVASPWRRLGAAVIDTVVFVVPGVALVGGFAALFVWWGRGGRRESDPKRSFTRSPRWNVVIWTASAAARVPTRNWRSPGYRALGLRRVDARTGEPLSPRNALVEQFVAIASGELRRRVMTPWLTRRRQRHEALKPELAEIQRTYDWHGGDRRAGDHEAQQRALMEFYKRENVNPAASCAPALLGAAVMQAPVLWSPRCQTIPERLAGIVVIQD